MEVLMLAHRLPYPPRTGDKVRAYHVARHLAREHTLTLACLADEPGSDTALAALRKEVPDVTCVSVSRRRQRCKALSSLARGGSATVGYFDAHALRDRVAARWRQRPVELVYVSSSSMAQYVPPWIRVPVLMDFVDVDSDKWRQYGASLPPHRAWLYRLEARRLGAHELAAARRADRCLLATRAEEALLHEIAPWVPTSVIRNGVDLDYFSPTDHSSPDPAIVFTGAMDYFPNVDAARFFCEWVFPRVRGQVPGARFVIVGKNPVPAVRRLGALRNVLVTGTVPDVRPYLREAAVAVAPLRVARGVQNKVLEAMAAGLPVVATAKAHEGLEARPGVHLIVEDAPAAFADALSGLLRDPGRRAELGRAARSFVETHHGWEKSLAPLDQVLDEVRRGAGSPAVQSVS